MDINEVFKLLKYRANKSGYTGSISSDDFNLVFNAAQQRYFLKLFGNQNDYQYGNPVPRIAYPATLKVSTSLSKFIQAPQQITINVSGAYTKPSDLFFIDSLSHYVTGTGGTSIKTLNTLVAGSAYTGGTYPNVLLTGGTGSGASATITVLSGVVTSVVLNAIGTGYTVNDTLSATIAGGSGFSIKVATLTQNTNVPIERVEKQDLASNLSSTYQAPSESFPIYVEYDDFLQFYPASLTTAQLTYLKEPTPVVWAYTLNGTIASLNTLVAGSGYVNGTYTNVSLTGGTGNSAVATIVVAGGVVTTVTITTGGYEYATAETLSASNTSLGGTGSGFSIKVATITNARQVYNPGASVDPEWNDFDIDEIIYMSLSDMGVYFKDNDLAQFAAVNTKTGGV